MRTKHIFITSFFAAACLFASAQTDSTLNKQVEVIKAYQPSINDAYKIGNAPRINDTITYSPTFEYNIHSRDIPVEKTINHLPVVQLGNAPKSKSNKGYLKGALGNAWTPYAELFVNTSPSRKTDFGLQLMHYSSRPNILLNNGLKAEAPNSNNLARIFVKNYFRKSVLEWNVKYERDAFTYYGFPSDSNLYRSAEINSNTLNTKQTHNLAATNISLKNLNNRASIDYNLNLGYDYFWNITGQSAHHANYDGLISKKLKSFNVNLGTKFEFFAQDSLIDRNKKPINNHLFYLAEISPKIHIDKDIYQLDAGFNLGTIIGADTSLLWNISPNINFTYHPIKGIMSLFIGANGGFAPNGLQQIADKNNYRTPNLEIYPSEETISINGGVKGKISRTLSYLFDINYSINKDIAFFYMNEDQTNSTPNTYNQFNVFYNDVDVLKFGGKLRYSDSNLSIDISGNYYIYNTDNFLPLPHMPEFDLKLNAAFKITKQISANINTSVIGPRNSVYRISTIDPLSNTIKETDQESQLRTIIDLGIGASYKFSKDINFFLNAKNILNQNYEYWQGYNHQGIQIMIGGTYTF